MNSFFLTILTVKIPIEILFWSLENREKFVRSMTVGSISVYNGRAMVIGCAEAGKTTLVKKIKGDRDLTTTSTSGIEIHAHAFKLNSDESTIIGKYYHVLYSRFEGFKSQEICLLGFCLFSVFLKEGNNNSTVFSSSIFSIYRLCYFLFSVIKSLYRGRKRERMFMFDSSDARNIRGKYTRSASFCKRG